MSRRTVTFTVEHDSGGGANEAVRLIHPDGEPLRIIRRSTLIAHGHNLGLDIKRSYSHASVVGTVRPLVETPDFNGTVPVVTSSGRYTTLKACDLKEAP